MDVLLKQFQTVNIISRIKRLQTRIIMEEGQFIVPHVLQDLMLIQVHQEHLFTVEFLQPIPIMVLLVLKMMMVQPHNMIFILHVQLLKLLAQLIHVRLV